jgi:hypothetical protein
VVLSGRERSQVRDEHFDMLERRQLVFATSAFNSSASAIVHPADLSRGHLGEDEVAAFQRPPEDRSRVAL